MRLWYTFGRGAFSGSISFASHDRHTAPQRLRHSILSLCIFKLMFRCPAVIALQHYTFNWTWSELMANRDTVQLPMDRYIFFWDVTSRKPTFSFASLLPRLRYFLGGASGAAALVGVALSCPSAPAPSRSEAHSLRAFGVGEICGFFSPLCLSLMYMLFTRIPCDECVDYEQRRLTALL